MNPTQSIDRFKNLLAKPRPLEAMVLALDRARLPPLQILLVDDDPDHRLIMRRRLTSLPLTIVEASDGQEAIERCRMVRPDVIFMDIEMPEMCGVEALEKIRALQIKQAHFPSRIVAFSAHDDVQSRNRFLAAGFDDSLSKSSSQQEIFLWLKGSQVSKSFDALSESTVFVDECLIKTLPRFLDSVRSISAQLSPALVANDRKSLHHNSHKLKGSFALYGFKYAEKLSGEIELGFMSTDTQLLAVKIGMLEDHLALVKCCSSSFTVNERTSG